MHMSIDSYFNKYDIFFSIFLRTSVNVAESCVATAIVDVVIEAVSGFGENALLDGMRTSELLATVTAMSVLWRSIGLCPTFSNSSVSVSDSNPLKK